MREGVWSTDFISCFLFVKFVLEEGEIALNKLRLVYFSACIRKSCIFPFLNFVFYTAELGYCIRNTKVSSIYTCFEIYRRLYVDILLNLHKNFQSFDTAFIPICRSKQLRTSLVSLQYYTLLPLQYYSLMSLQYLVLYTYMHCKAVIFIKTSL